MKHALVWPVIALALLVVGCSHPLEIVGYGDVISASGDRDCLYEQHEAGAANCVENLVSEAYEETYYGVARSGWHFHRWVNYCTAVDGNLCSFDVPADAVNLAYGDSMPPLVAIFRPNVITGFESLFIGHSFFVPLAVGMNFHAPNAGFTDHSQTVEFSGGASGTPEALWNNPTKRSRIQAVLDSGTVDLFGMTYHPAFPTLTGYRNWVDYALEQNPDTRFFIAMPWLTSPGSMTAENYSSNWHTAHVAIAHDFLVDTLRQEYPGVDFSCIPYGQAATELYSLYDAGNLPDVQTLVSGSGDAIFIDSFGHADDILVDLGELVWLRAIYGLPMSSYNHDPGYITDLKVLADAIMDSHDPLYDAP